MVIKSGTPIGTHTGNLLERYDWKRVQAPKAWRPKIIGEELIGFFGGKTQRNGQFGQYEVVIVHVPLRGSMMVSGTQAIQLIDASGIDVGWPVRIVWCGAVPLEGDKTMKSFEVYVAEGDPIAVDDLPKVKPQKESAQ